LTYLERQKCYGPDKKILFKKQLFDLEVKGQGPMNVITVFDTPPYGHAPTCQISLTNLKRQKCYGPYVISCKAVNFYVSPSNERRHTVLFKFDFFLLLPLVLLLISEACPGHNIYKLNNILKNVI
jgi:hypothetical protein